MTENTDPRQKIEDRYQRLATSRVPLYEAYREIVLEEQALGEPLKKEILVIRIDYGQLKLAGWLLLFVIALIIISMIVN